MNAVNDALAPLGARITDIPITPERVLQGAREGVARFVLSRVQAGGEDRAK